MHKTEACSHEQCPYLDGSIDYAGLFPPAALADPEAVAEFAEHRSNAALSWLMCRFVMPLGDAARAKVLAQGLAATQASPAPGPQREADVASRVRLAGLLPPVSLARSLESSLASGQADIERQVGVSLAAAEAFAGHLAAGSGLAQALTLDTLEWAFPMAEIPDGLWNLVEGSLHHALAELGGRLSGPAPMMFLEVNWKAAGHGDDPSPELARLVARIAALRSRGFAVGLKIRTGGLEAGTVPPVSVLARLVSALGEHSIPFKCTAGLHSALREVSPRFGFVMHGFVNILAFVGALQLGVPLGSATGLLAESSPQGLEAALVQLTGQSVQAVALKGRGLFLSFGSCSVREPLESLLAHGFVTSK